MSGERNFKTEAAANIPPNTASQFRSTITNKSTGIRVIIKKEPTSHNASNPVVKQEPEWDDSDNETDDRSSSSSNDQEVDNNSELSDQDKNAQLEQNTSEPSTSSHGRPFAIRRAEISSTALQEEYEGLENLGIEVYDQPAYESQVFQQVDRAISSIGGPPADRLDHVDRSKRKKVITLSLNHLQDKIVPGNAETNLFWQPSLATAPASTKVKQENLKQSPPHHEDDVSSDNSSISVYEPKAGDHDIESSLSSSEEIGLDDNEAQYETDNELGADDGSSQAKRRKLSPKKMAKLIDDGNNDYYNQRIKLYNRRRAKLRLESLSDNGSVETSNLDEMVTIDGDLQVPKEMWDNLFEHQRDGVKWLWELHQLGTGGILGDEMGLGKTIQMIALLTALRNSNIPNGHKGYENLGPTVLVCPATVMYQWLAEFRKWWPPFRVAILHATGAYNGDKTSLVRGINKAKGILIVSYPGVVIYQDALHDFDWHYAILDEGHKIRNPDAQVTLACKRFRTPHRIILSGSPVQNNLKELWSIFDFIYPGKLGTLPVFMEQFATPITQGGYANASDFQVQIAYKCTCILRDTIKPFLLRRTKAEVNNKLKLPDRSEQVLFCKLTDQQYDMYKNYLNSSTIRDIKAGMCQIFVGLTQLRKICNHPDIFDASEKIKEEERKLLMMKRRNENGYNVVTHQFEDATTSVNGTYGCHKKSGKMMVVDALLKIWKKQGHKVLLFTQSRQMLKIFVDYLNERDYKHLCMDGTTSIGIRQTLIEQFNKSEELFIFLLTTKVGGVGINLTGANRIIIFDPDWNPSTDIQARERAWRIGQKRQVIIYRLLTAGTIEEKIYHRQVFKLYLTNRILKDAKQKRFFKTNDLHELFTLGDNEKNIETKALFDDSLQINPGDVKARRKDKKEKRKEKKKSKKDKSKQKSDLTNESETINVLSEEKIKAMREQAKRLSQMIAAQYSSLASQSSSNQTTGSVQSSEHDKQSTSAHLMPTKLSSKSNSNPIGSTPEPEPCTSHEIGGKKKRVKYLVRQDIYRPEGCTNDHGEDKAKKPSSKKFDGDEGPREDYILDQLFKSSNVFGALKHDKIESDSTADFKVVESEAEKVARDAIRVLRQSRSMCLSSTSGIPNWTGRNGQLAAQVSAPPPPSRPTGLVPKNKSRAQQFLRKQQLQASYSSSSCSSSSITSSSSSSSKSMDSLLSSIKKRNQNNPVSIARETFGAIGPHQDDIEADSVEQESNRDFHGKSQGTGAELMAAKTRDFLLFRSSTPGQAFTSEMLDFFNSNFKSHQSAIFKAILFKMAEFHRAADKGIWKIRSEFRD